MDEINRQYLYFSIFIALVISLIINFAIFDILSSTFLYGFPMSLKGLEGFSNFFARLVNTLVIGLVLIAPVYFGIKWVRDKYGI